MVSIAPSSHKGPGLQLLVVVVCLFVLSPAMAKKSDRTQTMQLKQDSFSGSYLPNSITTLTGHVLVTQGSTKLSGDLAKVYMGADQQMDRLVMTGKPAHIEEQNDNDQWMSGDAAQLDYDNVTGIAVLTGQATVRQHGQSDMHADKLTYNTQTYQVTGEGNTRITLQPKIATGAPAEKN
jgi:lipopolysaccharide export system protein LptA